MFQPNMGPGYNIAPTHDREKVMFFISCRKLKNRDVMSKSDPQCDVLVQNPQSKQWSSYMKTEQI